MKINYAYDEGMDVINGLVDEPTRRSTTSRTRRSTSARRTIRAMATQVEEAQRDAFAERLFGAALGAYELMTVHLGDRLGYYRALAEGGEVDVGRARRRDRDRRALRARMARAAGGRRDPGGRRHRGSRRGAALSASRRARRGVGRPRLAQARNPHGPSWGLLRLHAARGRGGLPHRRRGIVGGLRPARSRSPGRREPARLCQPARLRVAAGRSPTCTSGSSPTRPRASPMSPAGPAGRASRSLVHTRR